MLAHEVSPTADHSIPIAVKSNLGTMGEDEQAKQHLVCSGRHSKEITGGWAWCLTQAPQVRRHRWCCHTTLE
jgi:hypothetical protein